MLLIFNFISLSLHEFNKLRNNFIFRQLSKFRISVINFYRTNLIPMFLLFICIIIYKNSFLKVLNLSKIKNYLEEIWYK